MQPQEGANSPVNLDRSAPLGLIAGNGVFPLEFAKSARQSGYSVAAVAHVNETDPQLSDFVDSCRWIKVGQLGALIKSFKRAGVRQVTFAGGISRVRLFGGVALDWMGAKVIARAGSIRDEVIFRAIVDELRKAGMEVFSAVEVLASSLPACGKLSRRGLSDRERKDARFGWDVAKGIGCHDIGQTVVVLDGVVLAVEAVEGTDAAIKRAGELCALRGSKRGFFSSGSKDRGPVVVKVVKPRQDLRVDLPTVGVKTIESMLLAGCGALVVEAGKTIMLDPVNIVNKADAADMALVACASKDNI